MNLTAGFTDIRHIGMLEEASGACADEDVFGNDLPVNDQRHVSEDLPMYTISGEDAA